MTLSVLDAAREAPDRVALVVGERTLAFRELAKRVVTAIAWLRERNVMRGGQRPVALVGRSDLGTLVLVHALIEIACPVALIHPRLTDGERRSLVSLVDPALVVESAPPGEFAPHRQISPPLAPATQLLASNGAASRTGSEAVDPESTLAILFTSGTTGEPKGVVLSRRAFVASARASEDNLGFLEDERWLLGLPIAHVGGLSVLTRCLLARRAAVVPRAVAMGERLTMEELARTMDELRVTLVSLVPTQLEWLLSLEPAWVPPPHLRAVLLGGAAARPALLARAVSRGVPVLTTYGLTEACSQVTTARYGATLDPEHLGHREGGVGAALAGTEVRLDDGVICVRGPTLLSGYLTTSGLTHALDRDGFFHTDDVGSLDESGNLHVLGRRSDMIVTGGENVYPAEVEAVLEGCPGVAAACVFGVPDEIWGQRVVAAVIPSGAALADAELAEYVQTNLSPHRRPRAVATVTAFATTPGGKLDRRETARASAAGLRPLLPST